MTDPSNVGAEGFRQARIFANLTEEESQRLLSMVEAATFGEGETLFCEGDARARMMMIQRGRVHLSRQDVHGRLKFNHHVRHVRQEERPHNPRPPNVVDEQRTGVGRECRLQGHGRVR